MAVLLKRTIGKLLILKDAVHSGFQMIGNIIFKMISYAKTEMQGRQSNFFISDFEYVDMITSAVLSDGPIYGKAKYLYLDEGIERYCLDFDEIKDGKEMGFIV